MLDGLYNSADILLVDSSFSVELSVQCSAEKSKYLKKAKYLKNEQQKNHNPNNLWRCPFIKHEQTIEKITKCLGNTFVHFGKPQSKLQCRTWVIRLCFIYIYIYTIFLCSFSEINKNRTNNWKNTKLWGSHHQYLNNPQPKFPCRGHVDSWVIRLNVSLYKYKFHNYMLFDEF